MGATVVKSLRIDADIDEKINNLIEIFPMSKNAFMQKAIAEKTKEYEEYAQVIQDVKDIKAGKTKGFSLEEVRKKYDLEG